MLATPEFMVQIAKGNYFYSVLYLFLYFGVAYIFLFVIDFSRKASLILKPLFFIILTGYTVLNLYCIATYHTRLTYDFIEIIAATNAEETREYLSMYVGWKEYCLIFLAVFISFSLYYFCDRLSGNRRFGISGKITAVMLICSVISVFINPTLKSEMVMWNFNFEDVADLSKYPSNPKVQLYDTVAPPEFLIVIIGESHSRSHSSLYGYDKLTNPLMTLQRDSGNLFVFNNVNSAATNTSNAFKYLLNTFKLGEENQKKWYKTTHLVEVLKKGGYSTYWYSNQAALGLYNNLSSGAAKLCDDAVFIREFSNDKRYDAELAEITVPDTAARKAVFYHLMGQHVLFDERYPETFHHFKISDYNGSKYTETQKEMVAKYDNATLYNDYTLSTIIEKFADKDAVIFYFPDHGLDMYDTEEDYIGHALQTPESQKKGKEIPFLVYLSPLYRQQHPAITERIKNSVDKPFTTDKVIYSVMDAIGLKFADNKEVEEFSLFTN